MLGFWRSYQQLVQRCCRSCSVRQLQILALFCLSLTLLLFVQPQRSEWLLLPLITLLWCLLLLFARQMFLQPPVAPTDSGLLARCRYWLLQVWHQLMLLLFLLLCLIALAFSLKLGGVILRAFLA